MYIGLMTAAALAAAASFGQSNPAYVQFSPSTTKGALYKPDSGSAPHVAIILTHRTANFLSHIATRELARRGFLVLAMNPRFENNESAVNWDEIALDIKSGVEYLRKQPGITKVILFGHSGGGTSMSYYQAVAEKGPSVCQGASKLVPCTKALAGLPPGDGVVFMDAHPGNSINGLRSVNPAVIDNDPAKINPALDPFNPQNGFNPSGPSNYSAAFKQKYFQAQASRMNQLIDLALDKAKRMKAGTYPYSDDDAFIIAGGQGARLIGLDPSLRDHTAQPRKLLKNDGTIATQIVESAMHYGAPPPRTATFNGSARMLTVRSFLSANAIRATNSQDGIDYCSTNNSVPCAVKNIAVPVLFAAMGGYTFIRDNELHYELAASKDKDFIVVEGATHGATPCKECEKTPGQYANSVKNFFDYVAKWINGRY
ncbi:MAG: alpha/beta hydrolase family protein [Bryobacteraceae bacterium]